MKMENRRERLGRDRLFVKGLRPWLPAFAGMTPQFSNDLDAQLGANPADTAARACVRAR